MLTTSGIKDDLSCFYYLACVRSQEYGLLRDSISRPIGDGARLDPERVGAQTVEALRRAVAMGFSSVEMLKKEKVLEPQRTRADFQDVLRKMERELATPP